MKSDSKTKFTNPSSGNKGSASENKKVETDRNVEASGSPNPKPSTNPSKSGSPAKPSAGPSQSPTSEGLIDHFVRIEKSDGNKATLVVSGPKIGSTIKITITSKGATK